MPTRNSAKDNLAGAEIVLCLSVRGARSSDFSMLAEACGSGAFYVNLEHGLAPLDLAGQICSAALALEVTPSIKVPGRAYQDPARALEGGAMAGHDLGYLMAAARDHVDEIRSGAQGAV
jgi:hypothetical protein